MNIDNHLVNFHPCFDSCLSLLLLIYIWNQKKVYSLEREKWEKSLR